MLKQKYKVSKVKLLYKKNRNKSQKLHHKFQVMIKIIFNQKICKKIKSQCLKQNKISNYYNTTKINKNSLNIKNNKRRLTMYILKNSMIKINQIVYINQIKKIYFNFKIQIKYNQIIQFKKVNNIFVY